MPKKAEKPRYRSVHRAFTPAEKERFQKAAAEEEALMPQRKHDAKIELAERVMRETKSKQRIDTVFSPDETYVVDAVDAYAEEHGLSSRGAVVRIALAKLLKVEIDVPHVGWQPGRKRSEAAAP